MNLTKLKIDVAKEIMKWRVEPLSNWPDHYPFREDRTEQVRIANWIPDPDDPVCIMIDETGIKEGELGCSSIPEFPIETIAAWSIITKLITGPKSFGVELNENSEFGTHWEVKFWRSGKSYYGNGNYLFNGMKVIGPCTAEIAICKAGLAAVRSQNDHN